MKTNKSIFFLFMLLAFGLVVSCSDDDPDPVDGGETEVISRVELTFAPTDGGDDVVAVWFDADGDGAGAPTIDDIDLIEGMEYTMTMVLTNTLKDPDEDITEEVRAEADEHMFFFEFTSDIFADPAGNGNVDSRNDPLNYNDQDINGLPLGLSTTWTAGAHQDGAEFRVILKHQPDIKSATSTAQDGESDVDITFTLNVEEDPNEEEEVINEVVLTFTPAAGGDAITATWFDADGDGVGLPAIDNIELAADTEYEMSLTLANTLGTDPDDITAEIEEEDDEHMFFFEFTTDAFSDPAGNGNFDSRDGAVNYNDQDDNGEPVGLSTQWTTGAAAAGSSFRIILKHQPGQKSSTSDATVGGTDVDISFTLNVN